MVRSDCPYTLDVRAKARGQREWLFTAIALLSIIAARPSKAQTCSAASLPYTLTNGSTADASQVMANFTTIKNCAVNTSGGTITGGTLAGTTSLPAGVITSSGSIGIGTLTPTTPLTVANTGAGTGVFLFSRTGVSGGAPASSGSTDPNQIGTFGNPNVMLRMGLTYSGSIWLQPSLSSDYSTSLNLFLAPNGGEVAINTAYPIGYAFYVNGQAAGVDAWINASDARLKTNIQPITDALNLVKRLRGVRFQWRAPADRVVGKDLTLAQGETHVGFIAQEVQAVVPEAVASPKDSNGLYGLKEADLIPVLVQAIKEQQVEIEALKALVSASKSSN